MASAKPLPIQLIQPQEKAVETIKPATTHWWAALKYLLLVPLFPLLGYYLLDQSGFSQWLIQMGIVPQAILGEGFGHVGLCFSIHYLVSAACAVWKALGSIAR